MDVSGDARTRGADLRTAAPCRLAAGRWHGYRVVRSDDSHGSTILDSLRGDTVCAMKTRRRDHLDVNLTDTDLREEVALLARLIVATKEPTGRLGQPEIDAALFED